MAQLSSFDVGNRYHGDAVRGENTTDVTNPHGDRADMATPTNTSLTANPTSSLCNVNVTFTATVNAVSPVPDTPTGNVNFSVNGSPTIPVPLTGNEANLTIALSPAGAYTVTADYAGDANFTAAPTATLTYTVSKSDSATALTVGPVPNTGDQPVTATATVTAVSPGSGIPTGTVAFTLDNAPATAVQLSERIATFSTPLTAGAHTITAAYSGDGCFNPSTSSARVQTPEQEMADTTLIALPARVRLRTNGTFVIPTLSATLTNSATSAPLPDQTITFGTEHLTGPVTLGTAVTNGRGTATCTNVTTSATSITVFHHTATFTGSPGLHPSTANASLTFLPVPLVP